MTSIERLKKSDCLSLKKSTLPTTTTKNNLEFLDIIMY